LEDRFYMLALKGSIQAIKFLLPFFNPKYREKKEQDRKVHIYHHVGVRPGVEPSVTWEDFVANPSLWDSYTKWLDSQEKRKK